jgi:hypothetical protein
MNGANAVDGGNRGVIRQDNLDRRPPPLDLLFVASSCMGGAVGLAREATQYIGMLSLFIPGSILICTNAWAVREVIEGTYRHVTQAQLDNTTKAKCIVIMVAGFAAGYAAIMR